MALSNGVYQIAVWASPTLCAGAIGSNVTTMPCANTPIQQWDLSQSAAGYTIKNVGTQNYTTWDGTYHPPIPAFLYPVTTSNQTWFLKQTDLGYVISPNNVFDFTWNVWSGIANNTPLIIYPTATEGNGLWNISAVTTPTTTGQSTSATEQPTGRSTSATGQPTGQSAPSKGHTTTPGAIAGASVGGAVGGIGLLILAWLQAHHLHYFFSSLGFALFGWALFGRRSFRFSADKDVGPVEISLFLSPREELEDSESLLVWEVVKIGHSRRDFVTYCPVISGTSDGETKIGFATLQDEAIEGVNCIKPEFFGTAPAKWNGSEFESLLADDKHVLELGPEGHEVGFAIGTYDVSKELFKPYYRLGSLEGGTKHTADSNLFLHAIVTHGYLHGQYGPKVVEKFRDDIVTPDGKGVRLTDLGPISNWHISKGKDGKLKLKLTGKVKQKFKE